MLVVHCRCTSNSTPPQVMLHLLLNICLVTVSSALALYFLLPASHVLGAAHLSATLGLFLQRFILWLHYSEHRRTFTGKGYLPRVLNMLPSMALCALFGIPPGMYRLHHIVMHHAENNMFPYDVSSTEPYQRDSFAQFLLYWVRYWAALWVELPCYALRRKRYAYFFQSSLCISGYAVGVSWLYRRHPTQTLWVFMLPFVAASLAMMFGNWSQHIFIDGKRPRNNYALTYNCINAADNLRSFNDGYHVVHHVNSKLHWSELPAKFVDTLDKHAEEGALVFEGVGFFDVGFLVFTRQLDKLAARIVQLGHRKRTHEELVRLLEERLKPVAQSR
eukprot:jgi/Chlat1/2145/Chrsp17S02722